MKRIVLIGGGDIGKKGEYETEIIDKKIVSLVKKEKPVFLFIGLASTHSDSYYDLIKKIYQNLGCETIYLKRKNIINNPNIVTDKINRADIIYIGGGDTVKLIEDIKEYQLENQLKKAYNKGCILVGISAGAILLSKEGYSDSYILRGESNQYQFIKGLNFVNICYCPHFEIDSKKEIELIKDLKNTKRKVFALENKTAILIEDNKIKMIKSPNANIYLCYKNNKEYIREELKEEK